jgi:hypothetical protein
MLIGPRDVSLLHSAHDNYRWSRFILKTMIILSALWAAQGVISRISYSMLGDWEAAIDGELTLSENRPKCYWYQFRHCQ